MLTNGFRKKAVLGIGAIFGLAALSVSATAQAAWHGTASHAHTLQKATLLGQLPDTQRMRIAVSLQLRNQAALDSFIQSTHTKLSPDYGRTLSATEFAASYGPSLAQAQAVASYLKSAGFSNIQIAANNLLVTAEGKRSLVETAFNTRIMQFSYNNRTVFANTEEVQVPDALNGVVLAITGLQNADVAHTTVLYPKTQPQARARTNATAGANPVLPTQFPQIYGVGGTVTGSTTNIGIISDGDLTQTVTDLRTFESQNGLAPVSLQFVPSEVNSTDTSGVDEWDLDSQTSTSMAGGVDNLYFFNAASLNDSDLEVAYNSAVTTGYAAGVKAINVSLGLCESAEESSGGIAVSDQIFKQAVAQGQTFFVSSGDGGAYIGCTDQEGLGTQVSYPASSPYVVAVGGTTLNTNSDGSYASETAWDGSGGGFSVDETAPTWQHSVTGNNARAVPDVAMDADPNSGAEVIISGSSVQIGGTSLAAPLATGTWARAESAHGGTLGFAAPLIYAAAASTPSGFHDVTSGCNNALDLVSLLNSLLGLSPDALYSVLNNLLGNKNYCAAAGFDEVTGFGSYVIGNVVPAL